MIGVNAPGPAKYDWSALNTLQAGRYAEYFTKMEFTLHGFDVYSSEVDDRGIDFVVRRDADRYFDIQVKSARHQKNGKAFNYVFFPEKTFDITRRNLFGAVVLLPQSEAPRLYLIPATAWTPQVTQGLLVYKKYEGKPSPPEWGLNLSDKHLPLLEPYRFELAVQTDALKLSPNQRFVDVEGMCERGS
jgi:hypothetical protein